ncbi:ataxin-10-like [Mytilus edulis]
MENTFSAVKSACSSSPESFSEWQHLNELLVQLKDCMLGESERAKLTAENLSTLVDLIHLCNRGIENQIEVHSTNNCLTEVYRTLRNMCVQCEQNQDLLSNHEHLFTASKNSIQALVKQFKHSKDSDIIVTLRCIVQFLGNCSVGHVKNQGLIWKIFVEELNKLFDISDEKLSMYTCMVAHTCISGNLDNQDMWTSSNTIQMLTNVISFTVECDCEWGLFLIESMCKVDSIFSKVFPLLKDTEKLLVYEVMLDHLDKTENDLNPSKSNIQFIAEDVKSQSYIILSLLEKHQNQNPVVIVKEIEILGIATSHHNVYPEVNTDKDLLSCIIYLLEGIHKIGLQGDNLFSRVDKIIKLGNIDQDHAGYCLKRDLVKLIGNMAYECKPNQDLIREMNGIPLVLDQTSIDGRNPYIQQWSVLAIHNICKDNNENKGILAGLKFEGLAEESDMLKKYGIKAEVKDNKIIVKPPPENE